MSTAQNQEILMERDWPEDYIRAVVSHGWGICSDVEPVEKMKRFYTPLRTDMSNHSYSPYASE